MNLPAHIITCSPPSMNLPAYGTTSPDPSLTSRHDNETRKAHYATQGTYSSWSWGFQCFHEPARSWSNSTNLPARSPTLRTYSPVVQHTWSTGYVPPHTQHLSSVSTEHTNLPCSYPHTRVTGYEPPCSYHHVFITNQEPNRSWQHQAYPRQGPIQQVMQNISQHTMPLHHLMKDYVVPF